MDGAYAIQYVKLRSEIGWGPKKKKLVWLELLFSKPMGAWDPISQGPATTLNLRQSSSLNP